MADATKAFVVDASRDDRVTITFSGAWEVEGIEHTHDDRKLSQVDAGEQTQVRIVRV